MKLKKAREVIEDGINQGLHPGAQLSVAQGLGARREEVNLAFGEATDGVAMTNDTLCLWLSCSKPLAAVAIGILWERDKLSLDDQVKHYIPEFAQHGKDVITIRHILTHTGGFRMADQASYSHTIKEALELVYDSKIEPRWHPGQKAGYHSGGSWLILGELIQRIDGRAYQTFVRQEIFEPLEMHDCWVGIPQDRLNEYEDQLAVMYKTTQGDKQPHPQWERSGEIVLPKPGSHGRGPARELRKFYDMLMEGGELDGVRLLEQATVEALTAGHRIGMMDHTFRFKIDFGLGFMKQSIHYGNLEQPYGFGQHASSRAYGHGGAESALAFADAEHQLTVAFLFNGMPGDAAHQQRARSLSEAIYQDLNLAEMKA